MADEPPNDSELAAYLRGATERYPNLTSLLNAVADRIEEPEWVAEIPDEGDRKAVRAVLSRRRWAKEHEGAVMPERDFEQAAADALGSLRADGLTPQCPMCREPAESDLAPDPLYTSEGPRIVHRACMLRSVIGGIGHLLDHAHFCGVLRDPDAGLDYRTSALLVDVWVQRHGIENFVDPVS
jgi:hypothetical protein